jgi:hypothetical protein
MHTKLKKKKKKTRKQGPIKSENSLKSFCSKYAEIKARVPILANTHFLNKNVFTVCMCAKF